MYGLGIRTGFYLQWFALVVAPWLAAPETQGFRLLNALFVLATSLALIIQTTANALSPAEIYVVLLLVFGSFYLTIPLFLWRLITGCSPNWDPSRWPRAPSSPGLSVVSFLLSLVLLGYQMWFWTAGVKERRLDCQQYGFLFAKIPIDNGGFIAWNILFNIAFLLGGMWGLCVAMALIRGYRKKPKRRVR
jgi:hypothetical protein